MKIYEAKNVWFKYENTWILEDINFSIPENIIFTIVGPNGGGKTTLLKLLLKLLQPTKGTVYFKNRPLNSLSRDEFNIGYVPQLASYKLLNDQILLTVKDVIQLGINKKHFNKEKFNHYLDMLNIKNIQKKLFSELSGGQKQRVLIARALINSPEVLILDEPVTGLDSQSVSFFYDILNELKTKEKLSIILVTHDFEIVPSISDIVGCMNKRLYLHEEVDTFYDCPVFQEQLESGMEFLIHGKNIPHRLVHTHKG